MKTVGRSGVMLLLAAPLLCGALLPQCNLVGGLNRCDFEKVSENGFDPVDLAEDMNHYAWAMSYFKADDADEGYVYVGTGNNIAGLIGYYITTMIQGGDILDAPLYHPEIRRYRPDLGPTAWERVFDYHDVEEKSTTTGFRYMTALQAADDDKQGGFSTYLYAATQGLESVLWRSKTGEPGSWESVFSTGEFGASVRFMCEHNGRIYLALAYDTYEDDPPPGEIWVSDDGLNFEPLVMDGFGNPNNRGMQFVISYNGWLYVGTKNDIEGYEVWKLEGPDKAAPVRVVSGGGPDPRNEIAGTPIVFKGQLYVGSIIFFGFNPQQLSGFKGCDIIRINENDDWETVVGPDSLSGWESGFNHWTNAYLWWMEEHDGWLYAGTWDQATILSLALANYEALIEFFDSLADGDADKQDEQPPYYDALLEFLYDQTRAGADIFKTRDGVHWHPVTMDGMGSPTNYGWRSMESAPDGYLYVGSANPIDGLEVWRATNDRGD